MCDAFKGDDLLWEFANIHLNGNQADRNGLFNCEDYTCDESVQKLCVKFSQTARAAIDQEVPKPYFANEKLIIKIKEAFKNDTMGNGSIKKKCPTPKLTIPQDNGNLKVSDLTGIVKLDGIEDNNDKTLKEILDDQNSLTLITDNQILFKHMKFGCKGNVQDLENKEDMDIILNSITNILNNKAFEKVTCNVRG